MAASPQHRAMSAVLSAPPGHPLRPTNAQLISMLWRFVREWRGDALESPAALEPPAAAMVGYDPHTPMDKLSKNMMPSNASAEAARVFLEAHWLKEGGERWRALVEERTADGLSGCTGLPQLSCNLCMVCVLGHGAAVGQGDLFGVIPQNKPQGHKNQQHKLALANCNVASARREAAAAEAAAAAATTAAAAADARVRAAEAAAVEAAATAEQAGRVRGLEQARKRLENDERRRDFINEHKITAVRKGIVIKELTGLSTSSTETWTTATIVSEELDRESSAPPTKRPVSKGRVGGKPAIAAAAMVRAFLPLHSCVLFITEMYVCGAIGAI
jgi:hypothetical protein